MAKKSQPSEDEAVANGQPGAAAESPAGEHAHGADLRPGTNLSCKVVAAEAGGYSVVILSKNNLAGYLPTDWRLQPGENIIAQFVTMRNDRAVLSAQMPTNPVMASWFTSVARLGLKRATDLMPAIAETGAAVIKIDKVPFDQLVTQLEGGRRTGVLSLSCSATNSRSAALLWRGSVAGCIYSNTQMPDPQPTDDALRYMVAELKAGKATGRYYDLPDVIALPFSAIFREYVTLESLDFGIISSRLSDAKDTACLAISLDSGKTYLAFFFKGKFVGTFDVERQQYLQKLEQLEELLNSNVVMRIGTSILPPDFFKDARRYTVWLSAHDGK